MHPNNMMQSSRAAPSVTEAVRERLEAELEADWNRDVLAVYIDHLLATGDPRGELLAADLHGPHGSGIERAASLLGDDLCRRYAGSAIVRGCFADLLINETSGDARANLSALAATPMWPYVRGVTVSGRRPFVASALRALADRRHPWLRRLTINAVAGLWLGRQPL